MKRPTEAQLRALREIDRYPGNPPEMDGYGDNALAWYAREKVLGALIRKGLIVSGEWALTAAGRAALVAEGGE